MAVLILVYKHTSTVIRGIG